jgi:hypothetical protein
MSTPRHTARLLAPFDATAIDLARCDRLEIVVTLYEHEHAKHGFETWPEAVQKMVRRQVEDWLAKNAARDIKCISTATIDADRACLLIIHHDAKGPAKDPAKDPATDPAPSPAPAPAGPRPGAAADLFGAPAAPLCKTCSE